MIIRIIGRFVINLFSKGFTIFKVEWLSFKHDLKEYKNMMHLVWLAKRLRKESQLSFDSRFKVKKVYGKRMRERV